MMTEKTSAEKDIQKKMDENRNQRWKRIFHIISLIALSFFWIGLGYAFYWGNDRNCSYYTGMILIFSLLNADMLFTRKKTQNKGLTILAKVLGALFFIWAIFTIISFILK